MSSENSRDFKLCIERSQGVTADMLHCIASEIDRIEQEITNILPGLLSRIQEDRNIYLKKSLEAWKLYIDSAVYAMYDCVGGTSQNLITSEWRMSEYARLLKWLKSFR